MKTQQCDIALSTTLPEAVELCRRRLNGEQWLNSLNGLNLGFSARATVPAELPELLSDCALRTVVHSIDLNLSTAVSERNLHSLRVLGDSLDVDWFEEDVGIWLWNDMFLGSHQLNPIQNQVIATHTAQNVRHCSNLLGRPFLIENPPVYYAEGEWDMWQYLAEIALTADCDLVLDVGHLIGYLINTEQALTLAPPHWTGWHKVRELHLSGYDTYQVRGTQMWVDRHSVSFNHQLLDWTSQIVALSPNLELITLELEGAPDEIVRRNLASVESILEEFA